MAIDGQENVLKAAVAAGVKRIIPSDFGNNTAVIFYPLFYKGALTNDVS